MSVGGGVVIWARAMAAEAPPRERLGGPAFYALRPGGWRDIATILHPPYTLWHLSYVALGAAAAPEIHADRLVAALAAFFLAVGLSAHALDGLHGRPLGTALSDRALVAIAVVGLAGAVGIGVAGCFIVSASLLPLVALGAFLVPAYTSSSPAAGSTPTSGSRPRGERSRRSWAGGRTRSGCTPSARLWRAPPWWAPASGSASPSGASRRRCASSAGERVDVRGEQRLAERGGGRERGGGGRGGGAEGGGTGEERQKRGGGERGGGREGGRERGERGGEGKGRRKGGGGERREGGERKEGEGGKEGGMGWRGGGGRDTSHCRHPRAFSVPISRVRLLTEVRVSRLAIPKAATRATIASAVPNFDVRFLASTSEPVTRFARSAEVVTCEPLKLCLMAWPRRDLVELAPGPGAR